jgi:hypothetical protein
MLPASPPRRHRQVLYPSRVASEAASTSPLPFPRRLRGGIDKSSTLPALPPRRHRPHLHASRITSEGASSGRLPFLHYQFGDASSRLGKHVRDNTRRQRRPSLTEEAADDSCFLICVKTSRGRKNYLFGKRLTRARSFAWWGVEIAPRPAFRYRERRCKCLPSANRGYSDSEPRPRGRGRGSP